MLTSKYRNTEPIELDPLTQTSHTSHTGKGDKLTGTRGTTETPFSVTISRVKHSTNQVTPLKQEPGDDNNTLLHSGSIQRAGII